MTISGLVTDNANTMAALTRRHEESIESGVWDSAVDKSPIDLPLNCHPGFFARASQQLRFDFILSTFE
jgi:hypothetical protein